MNEIKNRNAEKSLCWLCKYSVCLQEVEQESIMHPAESDNIYNESDEVQIIEHKVENERVKAICFWRPEQTPHAPPILVSFVEKCNRFKVS